MFHSLQDMRVSPEHFSVQLRSIEKLEGLLLSVLRKSINTENPKIQNKINQFANLSNIQYAVTYNSCFAGNSY